MTDAARRNSTEQTKREFYTIHPTLDMGEASFAKAQEVTALTNQEKLNAVAKGTKRVGPLTSQRQPAKKKKPRTTTSAKGKKNKTAKANKAKAKTPVAAAVVITPPKPKKIPPPKTTKSPVPTPTDEFGCTHRGIGAFQSMSQAHMTTYTEKGNFLYGESCFMCKKPLSEIKVASGKTAIYFCDTANTGFQAEETDQYKTALMCTKPALCVSCHAARVEECTKVHGKRRNRVQTKG